MSVSRYRDSSIRVDKNISVHSTIKRGISYP